jgi:hypothetical protein
MRWNIPFDNGEIIDYYQIHYCPGHKINGIWNEVENLCRTIDTVEYSNHELRDLTSDTYYRVELRAHNAIGFSTPTNFLLKTARGESRTLGTTVYKASYDGRWTTSSSPSNLIYLHICVPIILAVQYF